MPSRILRPPRDPAQRVWCKSQRPSDLADLTADSVSVCGNGCGSKWKTDVGPQMLVSSLLFTIQLLGYLILTHTQMSCGCCGDLAMDGLPHIKIYQDVSDLSDLSVVTYDPPWRWWLPGPECQLSLPFKKLRWSHAIGVVPFLALHSQWLFRSSTGWFRMVTTVDDEIALLEIFHREIVQTSPGDTPRGLETCRARTRGLSLRLMGGGSRWLRIFDGCWFFVF